MPHRLAALCAAAVLLALATFAAAQPLPGPSLESATAGTETGERWEFSLSASTYFVPDDDDYVSPVLIMDRDWLHLEARYNYEALSTASLWIGYNFQIGDKLLFEATPMIGGVFGDVEGVAPGYRLALTWGSLALSSEGEYLFGLETSDDNFFYSWSELTYSPADWLWFGLAAQRTRAYESDLDFQPGVLVGVAWRTVSLTTYVFNLGWEDPTVVVTLGIDF